MVEAGKNENRTDVYSKNYMNIWFPGALSDVSIDRSQLKRYKALHINNSQRRSEHEHKHEFGA